MHNLQKCFLKTVAPTVFQGSSSNKTRSESSERSLKESTKVEGTSLANGSKSKELSRLGTSTMSSKNNRALLCRGGDKKPFIFDV